MKKTILIAISSILLLSSCQTNVSPITYSVSNVFNDNNLPINPFNTAISLTMFNQRELDSKFKSFETEIHRLHRLFDSYNYYQVDGTRLNNLKVINDSYGTGQAIKVDQDLIVLVTQAIEIMKLTEGYFNPTIGNLVDLWSPLFVPFMAELGEDPAKTKIDAALACQASVETIDQIIVINQQNSTIQFNKIDDCQGQAKLALGAIAKGYAMEKVKPILGSAPYLIDGGRSSLVTNGVNPNPDRNDWNVVILTPYLGTNLGISTVSGSKTFTTSGDYENSFLLNNNDGTITIRHHILNPNTGYSENHYRSLTILSNKEAGLMDALGTALFNIADISQIKLIIERVAIKYNIEIDILLQKEIKSGEINQLEIFLSTGFNQTLKQDTLSPLVIKRSIIE